MYAAYGDTEIHNQHIHTLHQTISMHSYLQLYCRNVVLSCCKAHALASTTHAIHIKLCCNITQIYIPIYGY